MSATDRNSLVPLDRDLVYTSPLKARVTSVRNIYAIHIGDNLIISSSMSYFLGLNYCGAALLRLEKKHRTARQSKFIYDLQAGVESVNSRSTEGNRYL